MSIANLTDYVIPFINVLVGKFRDINVRTINANNDYDTTLFIGDTAITTDIQIGRFGGNALNLPSGILTSTVQRGGILGVGQLDIATNLETTSTQIGGTGKPLLLRGDLTFPSSNPTPLVINDSFAFQNSIVGFTGALIVAAGFGAEVSIYRIGRIATLVVRNIYTRSAPGANALNSIDPIFLNYQLPVGMRPVSNYEFLVGAYDNGFNVTGKCQITNAGLIGIGAIDTFHFTAGSTCGIMDFSINYFVA